MNGVSTPIGVKHRRSLYDVTGALEAASKYFPGLQVIFAPRAAVVLASKALTQYQDSWAVIMLKQRLLRRNRCFYNDDLAIMDCPMSMLACVFSEANTLN